MRAVWSFWSAPYLGYYHRLWFSERHHLLSWILSVRSAGRYYPDTWLFTDSDGARMLVDGLGLQFRHVDLRRRPALIRIPIRTLIPGRRCKPTNDRSREISVELLSDRRWPIPLKNPRFEGRCTAASSEREEDW
jgi:hypothetical protein